MGEGMAPYADTEHRRGFFGFKEHKPDAQTTAADATSTGPELTPAADVSPAAGDSGSEKTAADIGAAEAAVMGESTTVESPDMAVTNVDNLAVSPDGSAPVDLKDASAELGVGATETPDVASSPEENIVTPLTPTEDLLGEAGKGEADAAPDASADTATTPEMASDVALNTTPEAPAADTATSTFEAMLAEDADKKEKPVGPDSLMNPDIPVAESEMIDNAIGDQLNSQEPKADPTPDPEESAPDEAPTITATTSEITTPASEPASEANEFPTLKAEDDANLASDSTDSAPAASVDMPAPTLPESPLTPVDEAPATDPTPEASTTDTSENTPGASEEVAKELAESTPAAESTESAGSDIEVTPTETEATLASVSEMARKLSPTDKALLIAEVAGDMGQAA